MPGTPKFRTTPDSGVLQDVENSSTTTTTIIQDQPVSSSRSCSVTPPALPPRPLNLSIPSLVSRQSSLPSTMTAATRQEPSVPTYNSNCNNNNNNSNRVATRSYNNNQQQQQNGMGRALGKKYVILSFVSGLLCMALGSAYLSIYLVLTYNTNSMHYFQTMPTYAPSIPLFVTGVLIMAFSRKKYRNSMLIKACGCLCLVNAVLCVVVTVTTTVIHMNRLQTLRECVFQTSSQTCTCFAGMLDPFSHEGGIHYVFGGMENCSAIHGVLYSCLRALFGISVIGILLCIFSCMLVYQLLSHEKKKEYWSRLESRCQFMHNRGILNVNSNHHLGTESVHNSIGNANSFMRMSASEGSFPSLGDSQGQFYLRESFSQNRFMHPTIDNGNTGNGPGTQSISSLSSFRNWLQRGRLNVIAPATNSINGEISNVMRPNSNFHHPPHWRHSHPAGTNLSSSSASESNYGFHTSRLYNSGSVSCHHYLSSLQSDAGSGSNHMVPQYVWDPPPPYSQPTANQIAMSVPSSNSTELRQSDHLTNATASGNARDEGAQSTNHLPQQRTTMSGLLQTSGNQSSGDEGGKKIKNYCYSLPSRRTKRNKMALNKSMANLPEALLNEEELLMLEVRQKLNALLMYKYQHSKASRELTEVRQALHTLQMSALKEKHYLSKASANFKPPKNLVMRSSPTKPLVGLHHNNGGRNRNSTSSGTDSIENKYETIGKSLSPYKINKNVEVLTQSVDTIPEAVSFTDLGKFDSATPFSMSSNTSNLNRVVVSPTFSSCPSSSHYAQISPLKGTGLPKSNLSYFNEITKDAHNQNGGLEQRNHQFRNISQSDPKLNLSRPVNNSKDNHNNNQQQPLTPPVRKIVSIPNTPERKVYPVYLRPEQNIPDIFASTNFQPIESSSSSSSKNSNSKLKKMISRDDIVVTMRSAQV